MYQIIVVLICLFINMLLSGAEMAFVTVSKQQLKQISNQSRNARRLLQLKKNPERTLSVIQIGITVVGAIAAAVGGAGAEGALSPWLVKTYGLSVKTAEVVAILSVVLPISYLSVVVGELVPKTMALRYPTGIALAVAPGLYFAEKILMPAVRALEWSTHFVLKLMRFAVPENSGKDETIYIEDLPRQTKQYVINLVNTEKKLAREIMDPWEKVISVDRANTLEEVVSKVSEFRHTRLPVTSGKEVVGLLNTKELLTALRHGSTDWRSLERPILRFKSFDTLFTILRKMQEQKSHLAVIYDQVTPVGIVTMEDIFEEIIGDVFDEDDDGALMRILAAKAKRRPGGGVITGE